MILEFFLPDFIWYYYVSLIVLADQWIYFFTKTPFDFVRHFQEKHSLISENMIFNNCLLFFRRQKWGTNFVELEHGYGLHGSQCDISFVERFIWTSFQDHPQVVDQLDFCHSPVWSYLCYDKSWHWSVASQVLDCNHYQHCPN